MEYLTRLYQNLRSRWRKFTRDPEVLKFNTPTQVQKGQGFSYNQAEFVHHSDLSHKESAFFSVFPKQKVFFFGAFIVLLLGFVINWHATILTIFAALTILYFLDSLFNAFLIYRSFTKSPEIKVTPLQLNRSQNYNWPCYTVFCPLYKEWQVAPQFVKAMSALDYPTEKLQILLLLEEDDKETINKIAAQNLPANFEVIIVPHSQPKTKPKAMNYGLKFARGQYLVIYDAEDVPEPAQLKKAVLGFQQVPSDVVCIQAKLNFYNPNQNILTKIFTAEYSLWFDLVLTGLQSVGAPIPLGGTSNHFLAAKLRELNGWDAFNVTEDCDLGLRLAKHGYRTAIMDSITLEEANSGFKNWYRQRSRWIKGYMQTYLVHMRDPREFAENGKLSNLAMMQLTVGGKILSMFINPFLWLITAVYFLLRAKVGLFIEGFFPTPILYIGVASLVFGNFLYLYYYMIGCAKRGQYSLIKYAFLVPLYWLYMSAAAWQGLYEMIVKPHYWAKTQHGLHLKTAENAADNITAETDSLGVYGRLKNLLKGNMGAGSFLVASTLIANFLNLLFNIILGRALSLADFATVTLFNTILNIMSVGLSALASTVIYKTAFLVGQNRGPDSKIFLRKVEKYIWYIGGALTVLWAAAIPVFSRFFQVSNQVLALSFSPVILLGSIAAIQRGYLSGRFRFALVGWAMLFEAASKTLLAIALVIAGRHGWASLAVPASIVISFAASWLFVKKVLKNDRERLESAAVQAEPFPFSYFGAALVGGFASTIFLNCDVLLSKHYMDPTTSGAYSLLSLVGKMVYLMGTLLSPFVITVISKHEGAGTNSRKQFYQLLAAGAGIALASFAGIVVLGKYIVPLLFGSRSLIILPDVGPYCLAMALFSVSSIIVSYHMIKKRYSFPVLTLASSAYLIIGIMLSNKTITGFTQAMAITGFISFTVILAWHFVVENSQAFVGTAKDLLGAFTLVDSPQAGPNGKKILMFNWRDTSHAYAGGAEVYVHELAKRWAAEGNHVTLFCGNDGHQPKAEIVDGVHVVRRGGFYFVYVWAFVYYQLNFRGKYDVILDCHNGIPFFTPLFTREKVYCLMHHVHQDVFYKYLWWPLAAFAAFLEGRLMPVVYRNTKFITISDSSKTDMLELGLGKAGLEIVHPGVNLEALEPGKKHDSPIVLYLGRLKAYKSVDVLIRAFAGVKSRLPQAKLVIAGDGEERENLKRLANNLGLSGSTVFTGKISELQKIELLQKAWVFCNPSMMEGWGITTIEANACGVPVVAANVPGLRDSVRNPHTGYLVEHGNVEAFAQKILEILVNPDLHKQMRKNSLEWADNFGWDKSANQALRIIYE